MVDKITVNPGEVRGAGNIVSPKSLSDFSCYASKLSAGTESVNGANMTVYTEQYLQGTFFWSTYIPRFVPYTGQESFNVPTTLTKSGVVENISGATVKCYVNNELLSTDTTDSNGDVEFTIPLEDSVNVYNIKLLYAGDNTNAGCFLSRKIVVGDVEDLDLIAESDITQTGETDQLLATLSGVGIDGESIGIPGQSVSLYESWTPGLRVSAPIVQSGDVANINAQLVDAADGSLVRESGETIRVYEEWTPGLKILAPNIIQSADTVNATVQLVDTVDGSYVRESGHSVTLYAIPPGEYDDIPVWNETGYTTDYYPTPIEITGEMKAKGSWGGLRIYGDDNDHHYVYLGQNNSTNDENAKIFYKTGINYVAFRIIIANGSVSLYIDNTLIETVSTDTSKSVSVWGGSSSNKVDVKNVKLKEFIEE